MLSNIKSILLVGLVSVSFAANATDYLGVDYKYRSMKGRSAANYNLRQVLSKTYSSAEIYFMHRFYNNVGINLGYEQSKKENKRHTFSANELYLGDTQNAGDQIFTHARIKAGHLDVVGFYEVSNKVDAIGQLGLAIMQVAITGNTIANNVTASIVASRNYRVIPRIGLGMQYFPIKHLGVRATLNWEGTNMYRIYMTDEDGVRRSVKPYKQSWSAAIGLVGRF